MNKIRIERIQQSKDRNEMCAKCVLFMSICMFTWRTSELAYPQSSSAYSLTRVHHSFVVRDDTAQFLQPCEKWLAGWRGLFYQKVASRLIVFSMWGGWFLTFCSKISFCMDLKSEYVFIKAERNVLIGIFCEPCFFFYHLWNSELELFQC